MGDLINDLRGRIEQDEQQQHHGVGNQRPVWVLLRAHVQRHKGNPEHEPDANDIPKILSETVEYVFERDRPRIGDGLFDQAERGSHEYGIDGA